jgi:hypothetical protein
MGKKGGLRRGRVVEGRGYERNPSSSCNSNLGVSWSALFSISAHDQEYMNV